MEYTMRLLYLCNKKQECNMSPICGLGCRHTGNESFRLIDNEPKNWQIKRCGKEVVMVEEYA